MSQMQVDVHQILTSSVVGDTSNRQSQMRHSQPNNIVQQVVNNQMFKFLLKDMIQEIMRKKNLQEQEDKIRNQDRVSVQSFIQQIGDTLMLVAQNQTNKKIKQAEKFLNQLYQHKVKELQDKFEYLVDKKVKQLELKLKQIEQKTKVQSSVLSPVRSPFKHRQILQHSVCDQINRRMQLKQKILNCSVLPEPRNTSIAQVSPNSIFSQSLNDAAVQRLSQKIKQIQQNFKSQLKSITAKIGAIKNQTRTDMQSIQQNMKQQLNSGFEGIWNVISNLEKRMMI